MRRILQFTVRTVKIKLLTVRRSLPLFLAVVAGLAMWQVWLTWRLLEQDRNLSAQRSRERLEQIADLSLAQLATKLDDWDAVLRDLDALPPAAALKTKFPGNGTLILLASNSFISTYPNKKLLFVPEPPGGAPILSGFETANKLEFREENFARAVAALLPLAQQPGTRAESLLRIARLEQKLHHPAAALSAYDQLSREPAVTQDGVPYALLAAGARCDLEKSGDAKTLERLRAELLEGRWPLRRETFEYYWAKVNRLERRADNPPKDSMEFSVLVSQLRENWRQVGGALRSTRSRLIRSDGSLLIVRSAPSRLTAFVAPAGWLHDVLKFPANANDVRWRLHTLAPPSTGPPANTSQGVRKSLADAQLAARLEFFSASANTRPVPVLWLAAVALMLLLVLAGAYAMYRGVSRELHVAQLQSDFVSAVSHEFRSPLTTLRGITELLSNGRITDATRLRQSYGFLERETGRLHRLVEDLLDFGRMESGRKLHHMEPHDAFIMVREAVTEFRDESLPPGFQLEMHLDARNATVKADEEALRRAIRNLLENAVKYSPECRTVWVEGRVGRREVAISVRDRGMGIDTSEHSEVFQKFVRGAAAKRAGIKGTGIGLSMVRQIVEACGGKVRLESEEGAGSTFTILLPLAGPPWAGARGAPT